MGLLIDCPLEPKGDTFYVTDGSPLIQTRIFLILLVFDFAPFCRIVGILIKEVVYSNPSEIRNIIL